MTDNAPPAHAATTGHNLSSGAKTAPAPPARSGALIPTAGVAGSALTMVMAIMAFLASLALGAALTITAAAADWTAQLTSAVTVQIVEVDGTAPAEQRERALALLTETPGIAAAEAVTDDEAAALLEPWLGSGNVIDDLPIPQLINVELDRDAPPDLEALAETLESEVEGARLDSHGAWRKELRGATRSIQATAAAVFILIMATAVAIVAFATRASLAANRHIVEILHLTGARDVFIAREFQRHFLWLGLKAGFMGIGLAGIAFALMGALTGAFSGGGSEVARLVPVLGLSIEHFPFLAAIPFVIAAVAMVTARNTVLRTLAHML